MNSDKPTAPTLGQVIGAAKDALIAKRGEGLADKVERGRYADIFAIQRGQFERARRRLADEVQATLLETSTGKTLAEVAANNFDAPAQTAATRAIGEVVLARQVFHFVAAPSYLRMNEAPPSLDDIFAASIFFIALDLTAAVPTDETTAPVARHFASVYNAVLGAGAHRVADTQSPAVLPLADNTMGSMVATLNSGKIALSSHFENLVAHHDADFANLITAPNAFASDPAAFFGTQTLESQASLVTLATQIQVAWNAHVALESRGGSVRKGTRFFIQADDTASPPIKNAQYATTQSVAANVGDAILTCPIEATLLGPDANQPAWSSGTGRQSSGSGPQQPVVVAADALFDNADAFRFAPTSLAAAGGSRGQADAVVRQLARASYRGTAGPTNDALIAGALRGIGAAKIALLEDRANARVWLYLVDPSWAQSAAWLAQVQQALIDTDEKPGWLGVGCRLGLGAVVNQTVRCDVTVVLRDQRMLAGDTQALTTKIQDNFKDYFENRPDWYMWRASTLRARATHVDRSILTCPIVTLRDSNGVPIVEPNMPQPGSTLTHWYLSDAPINVSYTAPV